MTDVEEYDQRIAELETSAPTREITTA